MKVGGGGGKGKAEQREGSRDFSGLRFINCVLKEKLARSTVSQIVSLACWQRKWQQNS